MFLKKCTLARLLDTASKFALFSASSLKDEQLIKKQTYMKTETCSLYSGVFLIFLPNFIKIDPYNFELYRLKVCAFFETQCMSASPVIDQRKILFYKKDFVEAILCNSLYFNEIQSQSYRYYLRHVIYCRGIVIVVIWMLQRPSGLFCFISLNLVFQFVFVHVQYFLAFTFYRFINIVYVLAFGVIKID